MKFLVVIGALSSKSSTSSVPTLVRIVAVLFIAITSLHPELSCCRAPGGRQPVPGQSTAASALTRRTGHSNKRTNPTVPSTVSDSTDPTDVDLARRIAAGDEAAFDRLYGEN